MILLLYFVQKVHHNYNEDLSSSFYTPPRPPGVLLEMTSPKIGCKLSLAGGLGEEIYIWPLSENMREINPLKMKLLIVFLSTFCGTKYL